MRRLEFGKERIIGVSIMKHKIGVVLLSGGLDSTTTAAYAKSLSFEVHALTFHYGQKLSKEVESAKKVANILGLNHKVIDISVFKDLAWYSVLTHPESFKVPKGRGMEEMRKEIPTTYVPFRNTFFISARFNQSGIIENLPRN